MHRRTAHDLHDGAQQRLVSLMIGLRLARELIPPRRPRRSICWTSRSTTRRRPSTNCGSSPPVSVRSS
ncbi:histidine kinase [Streptomyces sp. NPDC001904]|uniref:histidine kinase n=1 Tax=Streptomyces sp. NPDC001904 TaxID=3154531 RepID=UPI0033229E9A